MDGAAGRRARIRVDYTAFLDHIGVASLDMGLNGRGGDGSYHST